MGSAAGDSAKSNDEVWIDIGLPTVHGADGRNYRPLVAPLITDFEEVANAKGSKPEGSLETGFIDLDVDGRRDIFIARAVQGASPSSMIYRNLGDGRFEQIGLQYHQDAFAGVNAIEGNYLQGYGIAFTVSLPVYSFRTVKKVAKPAAKAFRQAKQRKQ